MVASVRLVDQFAFEIGRNIVPLQPAVKCRLRLFQQMNGFRKTRFQRSCKGQSLGRRIKGCANDQVPLLAAGGALGATVTSFAAVCMWPSQRLAKGAGILN